MVWWKKTEKHNEEKPREAPKCEHDDWEIVDSRNFYNGGSASGGWCITVCKVCGAKGGMNY